MESVEAWGRDNHVMTLHSQVLDRLLSDGRVHKPMQFEAELPLDHSDEYLSYLLHLNELLSCDVSICTLASNYCRILDEIRSTVGGMAHGYSADLSIETCAQPPCINQHGLANHPGKARDPKGTIW